MSRFLEHLYFYIWNANSKTGFKNKKGDLLKDVYSINLDCTVTFFTPHLSAVLEKSLIIIVLIFKEAQSKNIEEEKGLGRLCTAYLTKGWLVQINTPLDCSVDWIHSYTYRVTQINKHPSWDIPPPPKQQFPSAYIHTEPYTGTDNLGEII